MRGGAGSGVAGAGDPNVPVWHGGLQTVQALPGGTRRRLPSLILITASSANWPIMRPPATAESQNLALSGPPEKRLWYMRVSRPARAGTVPTIALPISTTLPAATNGAYLPTIFLSRSLQPVAYPAGSGRPRIRAYLARRCSLAISCKPGHRRTP